MTARRPTRTRRFAAFLRGVSPMNARMSELRRAFEAAGFTDVRTLLSSGNVVFGAPAAPEAALERRAEEAMEEVLGRAFLAIARPLDALRELLGADPYSAFRLARGSKRVVTFPREPPALPIALDAARILAVRGREVLSAYVPGPRGPVFMQLIERTFGTEVTTQTWDTVREVAGDRVRPAGGS